MSDDMSKIKKHIMSITYGPKIKPVQDGLCVQTIRKGKRFAVGDSILIHGWSNPKKPYRSPWNGQMRVTVVKVATIKICKFGIGFIGQVTGFKYCIPWEDERLNELATADFIDPPTGIGLRDVLFDLNSAPSAPLDYQVVIWEIDGDATKKLRENTIS